MSDLSSDQDLQERLKGYPEEFRNQVLAWRSNPNPAMGKSLAEGILRFHVGEEVTEVLSSKGPDALLVEDLGLDSLTMVEIAFESEEFLGVHVDDDALRTIRTFGHLQNYIEEQARKRTSTGA